MEEVPLTATDPPYYTLAYGTPLAAWQLRGTSSVRHVSTPGCPAVGCEGCQCVLVFFCRVAVGDLVGPSVGVVYLVRSCLGVCCRGLRPLYILVYPEAPLRYVLPSTYLPTDMYTYLHPYHTHTYSHTHRQADGHTEAAAHRQTYIQAVIHTYTHTERQRHIHTHIHTYIHTQRHTQIYIHAYTYKHIHANTHTHMHACIHTYTHAYIYTNIHTHI